MKVNELIKSIKEIHDTKELQELKKMYINYFKEYHNMTKNPIIAMFSNKMTDYNEVYADEMLYRIRHDDYVGYAYYEGDSDLVGFISGRYDYADRGWISHFYVKRMDLNSAYEKKIAFELFKEISLEFKRMGLTKVATEVNKREYSYRDILYSLNFDEIEEYDNGVIDFGREL